MFKITEGDFKNQVYGDESYLTNWPMLYILENGKQAYIGESNHVKNRMSQHHGSVDKRIFDKVHFIYSSKFNQSVTFDYESKLIQYIVADELYEVRNKNVGMADKEYYGKKEHDEKFQVLWRSLQREKIVKHSLEELENSDLFKYSPFKKLNNDQRTAVEEIVESLKQEEDQMVVVNGIAEEDYSNLTNQEEGNLYQIVLASTYQIGRIKSYLRRFVEKDDVLDMDEYRNWIKKLYDEWPFPGQILSSGRVKKKNAGEVSITILGKSIKPLLF